MMDFNLFKHNIMVARDNYDVMDMSAVTRYNNGRKFLNRHENVAEHSTHVALNAIKICNMLDIPEDIKYKAATWAVLHDIPEPLSADLPYEFKTRPEAINMMSEFERFERKQVELHYPFLYKDYMDFVKSEYTSDIKSWVAKILVDLGDALVVYQYASLEMDMGNKTYEVVKFKKLSQARIDKHTAELYDALQIMKGDDIDE